MKIGPKIDPIYIYEVIYNFIQRKKVHILLRDLSDTSGKIHSQRDSCSFNSQHIGQVTPEIIKFHYEILYIYCIKVSRNNIHLVLKTKNAGRDVRTYGSWLDPQTPCSTITVGVEGVYLSLTVQSSATNTPSDIATYSR